MNQDQDLMSRMKRLKRVDQEGGSMNSEERAFFEEKIVESEKLGKLLITTKNLNKK